MECHFSVLDRISLGICIIDRNYDIIFWNIILEDWTGLNRDSISGKNISDYYPQFNDFIYRSRIDSIFSGGPPVILSPQLHKKLFQPLNGDLKERILQINISSIASGNESEYFALFSIEDVTELSERILSYRKMRDIALQEIEQRKKAEEILIKSEVQLRELNATKDKFFSILAHDLRNPLGAFRNILETLMRMFDDFTKEEVVEFITEMYKSAKSIYNLLENLLAWSRSQTGKLEFNPEITDLYLLTDNVLNLVLINASSKNISIIGDIPRNIFVRIDRNMISTVIRNLLSNAVKFTPEGGVINLSCLESEVHVTISVKDNGVGISEEDIKKLFRLDVNITTIGTAQERGTGLGLILCKEFVEKHDGKIWVESIPGEGSTFRFTLPKFSGSVYEIPE